MKKSLFLVIVFIFMFSSISYAEEYEISKLTDKEINQEINKQQKIYTENVEVANATLKKLIVEKNTLDEAKVLRETLKEARMLYDAAAKEMHKLRTELFMRTYEFVEV